MKRHTFFVIALFSFSLFTGILHASSGDSVDTVAFWKKVNTLLKKEGYDENTEFGRHARTNLRRVETLRENQGATASSIGKGLAQTFGFTAPKAKRVAKKETRVARRETPTTKKEKIVEKKKPTQQKKKKYQAAKDKKTKKKVTAK